MKKAIQRLFPLFLLCLALTLSGCQATPQSVEDSGAQRAMTQEEQAVAQTTKSPYAQECQDDGRQIDVAFGEGDQQLIIRATAQVPQVETVYSYVLTETMPDQDAIISTFFSQSEKIAEVEPVWCDTQLRADMGGITVGTLRIHVEDTWPFEYSLDDGLPSQSYDWDTPPSSVQIDPAAAKAELDRIAQGLGLYGVTIDCYRDGPTTRTFEFYPNYTPFDVASVEDRGSSLGLEKASFSPESLTYVFWMDFCVIEDSQPVETLLSLDEAINIASQYVGSDLQPLTAAPFTQVSLRVRYQRDVTEEDKWTARPVWYFATDDTSFMLPLGQGPGGATEAYTSAFAIDAQTGVLEINTTYISEI